MMWLEALDLLSTRLAAVTDLSSVKMIAGSGQQHGSVYLDASFDTRLAARTAPTTSPIWMDTSTEAECTEITATLGGSVEVCRRSGSVAIERFTGDNPASLVRMGAPRQRGDFPGHQRHRSGA